MDNSPLHAAEERILELEKRLMSKEEAFESLMRLYKSCSEERDQLRGKLALAVGWAQKMIELFNYKG